MVGVDVVERQRRGRSGLLAVDEPLHERTSVGRGRDGRAPAPGDDDRPVRHETGAVRADGDDEALDAALVAAVVGRGADGAVEALAADVPLRHEASVVARVDAGRIRAEAEVAVFGVDEEGIAVELLAEGIRGSVDVEEAVVGAVVGRPVFVEDGVVDEGLHQRAVGQAAVVGEGAVVEAAVRTAARAAALVRAVVDHEAVRRHAVEEPAAVARVVVADDAADQVRVVGAAAVVGDVVLEDALDERAPLRAAAAVLVVRAD